MSLQRPHGWEEGETLGACDICGFPYRFPSEMVYADDKQFYCLRTCWKGETVTGHNRRRAAWKPPRDSESPRLPVKPPGGYT